MAVIKVEAFEVNGKVMDKKTLEALFMTLGMGILRKIIEDLMTRFNEEDEVGEKEEQLFFLSVVIPIYIEYSAVKDENFIAFQKKHL